MATVQCTFIARDTGHIAQLGISTDWSVRELRGSVEQGLGIRVHTLKYKRREIVDGDDLQTLNLQNGATIFVNSQTLAASLPAMGGFPRHPASAPPPGVEAPVEWRRARPRVCGFSEEVIEQRVQHLIDLGFVREDCQKALKAAAFNMDRAVDYLLSGRIPEPLVVGDVVRRSSRPAVKVAEAEAREEMASVR